MVPTFFERTLVSRVLTLFEDLGATDFRATDSGADFRATVFGATDFRVPKAAPKLLNGFSRSSRVAKSASRAPRRWKTDRDGGAMPSLAFFGALDVKNLHQEPLSDR